MHVLCTNFPYEQPNIPWHMSSRYGSCRNGARTGLIGPHATASYTPTAVEIEVEKIRVRLSPAAWDRFCLLLEHIAPVAATVLVVKFVCDLVEGLCRDD